MRIIISAGGTGGHIYPALSIIKKVKEKSPKSEILYIGTTDRMEKDIIPNEGINYCAIKIRGIDRKLSLNNVKTIIYFINALKECKKIIKEFKPDIVIGVGGYVTAPVIYAAHKLNIKTIIHEQNSMLGMTNKFLSKYTDAVAISFPETIVNSKRVVYTGNPCSEVDKTLKFDKSELNLSENKKLVLIVMGSLGSKVVTEKMKEILPKFKSNDYEVLFVTGKDYINEFNNLKLSKNVKVVPFINNLKKIFSKVDVMITRAGATTISEIISYKVPSILVPSPYVTDNHQYKNAMSLVDKDASLLIEESQLDYEVLNENINILLDKNKSSKIRNNLSMMAIPQSASKIYDLIKEVVEEK